MDCVSKLKIITWNVRGLYARDKRITVRQTILIEKPYIICFQETKLDMMNNSLVMQTCGRRFRDFAYLDATGTNGGIMVAWNGRKFNLIQTSRGSYHVTVVLQYNGDKFFMTSVYGPSNVNLRRDFFQELSKIKPTNNAP